MSNCYNHKKEVCGISDMKVLAEMISDLHYETLAELFKQLSIKISLDGDRDFDSGKKSLGNKLISAGNEIGSAAYYINRAWESVNHL